MVITLLERIAKMLRRVTGEAGREGGGHIGGRVGRREGGRTCPLAPTSQGSEVRPRGIQSVRPRLQGPRDPGGGGGLSCAQLGWKSGL